MVSTLNPISSIASNTTPLKRLFDTIFTFLTGRTQLIERLVEERTATLADESRKNQILLRSTSDGLHILDASGQLVEASHSFFRMLGYQRDELIGRPSTTWWPDDAPMPLTTIDATSTWQENAGTFEAQFRRKDGSQVDVELTAFAIELDGQSHISLSARDISERKQAAEQIRQLAFYDSLTGLPNRRLLVDRSANALALAKRHQRMMAVMFLDLDKFKNINDTLGHDAGDELLKEVGNRLTLCVRASDTVARQGGDEFVIMLSEISDARDAERVAEHVIKALAAPVMLCGQPHRTTTSIGVCIFSGTGNEEIQDLMKKADSAMYEAKQAGRNCFRFAG